MHSDAASIPWYRRSDVNTFFVLSGLLVPPLLWFACFNLITGDVYYTRRSGSGRMETWSTGNRYLAYLFLGAQLLLILYVYSTVAWLAVAGSPDAEAVVARYFETRKRPVTDPPSDLYGEEFWRTVSPDQLQDHLGNIRAQFGAVDTFHLVGIETDLADLGGWVRLEYDVRYERGRLRETFLLSQPEGDSAMRIQGHDAQPVD